MSTVAHRTKSVSRWTGRILVETATSPVRTYRAAREIYRPDDDNEPEVFEEMTLIEHLTELRNRMVTIVIGLIPAFIVGFIFAGPILDDIRTKSRAINGMDVRSPTEPLTLTFKIALYIAIALGMPLIVYQVVGFLAPGLTRKEKRVVFSALPFISVLFLSGAAYGYFLAAPQALRFLSTWNSGAFNWQPDGPEVISFFMTLMLGLGFAFQLPVIMFILAKIGVFPAYLMRKWRKYAILVISVAAAVITPSTDPFNMAIVAVPLYVLYEAGILISSTFAKTSLRTSMLNRKATPEEDVSVVSEA
ncbi:MAG: twin-arginine translocase subunit TatC [Thermomicrobiales bacterium]